MHQVGAELREALPDRLDLAGQLGALGDQGTDDVRLAHRVPLPFRVERE